MPKNFLVRNFSSFVADIFETELYRFICKVKEINKSQATSFVKASSITPHEFDHILRCQITSRLIDLGGKELFRKKHGFYDLNNMGHEGLAAISIHLNLSDPKLLHYRSGAAFIEWLTRAGKDSIEEVLGSIVCSRSSFSGGSHKVFGSLEASVIPQTSTIASQMPKAVGLAFSIQKARQLNIKGKFPHNSVVFCSFGDGSFNHGSAQEAFNMIEWLKFTDHPMPVVMACENNGLSISSENPPGYIEAVMGKRHGFHYVQINSLHIIDAFEQSKTAIAIAREEQKPVFMDIKTSRLGEHYLSKEDGVEFAVEQDPVLCSIEVAFKLGYSLDEIIDLIQNIGEHVEKTLVNSVRESKHSFYRSIAATSPTNEIKEIIRTQSKQPLTLAQALNNALIDIMKKYREIIVFGDDVANEKGGVWGVTKDLGKLYGQHRIFNTTISETSILATAQMMGLNGLMPVIEIRHLAFLHNAIDQIRGEAATTQWLSNGHFASPFVLRIPGLGYNVNGGHFHNDAGIAALREIPGIMLVCASRAETAGSLLKYCVEHAFKEKKIIIFIEPIALYQKNNQCDRLNDRSMSLTEPGIYGSSDRLTLISYGNGFDIAMEIAEEFQERSIDIQVIDLRWLKPLPMHSILEAIKPTAGVLIIDEGRRTGSLSEEIYTRIQEEGDASKKLFRITGDDAFVPLGQSTFSVFPTKEKVNQFIEKHVLAADKNQKGSLSK